MAAGFPTGDCSGEVSAGHNCSIRLFIVTVFGLQDAFQPGHEIGDATARQRVIHRCTFFLIAEDTGVFQY